MPELPEVQAHAERLGAAYAGAALERFTPLTFHALKTAAPDPAEASGLPLIAVGRRGKFLVLQFEPVAFVVHLMQGGRLNPDPKRAAKPRGGLARWSFEGRDPLVLTEAGTERKAGVWVRPAGDLGGGPPLDGLGPEADAIDPAELAARFAAHPMRLHTFLRDQRLVAGLGRRLANEVCHAAKLSPFAATAKLGAPGAARVVEAIRARVAEGLAFERSRPTMSASAERPGAVHRRTGEACPACGDVVRAVEYSAYTVHYCATCQTGGKVLVDNTTSKFLR